MEVMRTCMPEQCKRTEGPWPPPVQLPCERGVEQWFFGVRGSGVFLDVARISGSAQSYIDWSAMLEQAFPPEILDSSRYPAGEVGHGLLLYLHKVAGLGVLELAAGPTVGWQRRELIVLGDVIANNQSATVQQLLRTTRALQCNFHVCPIAPVVLATGYTGELECICDESVGHINCAGSRLSIAGNHPGFCAPSQPRADTLAADSCQTLRAGSAAATLAKSHDSSRHRVFTDTGCSVQTGMFSCAILGGPVAPECIPGGG